MLILPLLAAALLATCTRGESESAVNSLSAIVRNTPTSPVDVLPDNSTDVLRDETSAVISNATLSDIESDDLAHAMQIRCRQRKKAERIYLIRQQILGHLQMQQQHHQQLQHPPALSDEERQRISSLMLQLHHSTPHSADDEVHMLQSSYPSCSVPIGTDAEAWDEEDSMHVSYEVRPLPDLSVVGAKLRLHTTPYDHEESSVSGFNQLLHSVGTNTINVNVYQLMKPLRANRREKKRLIDSRTIPVDYYGWVDFNVTSSLRFWFRHMNRNFGFDVQVEDALGHELNPRLFFHGMNCSSEGRPFPNLREMYEDVEVQNATSSLLDNETFPTLDLRTARNGHDLTKRSADGTDSCVENQEYVSFKTLGIDNMISSPEGFRWTVCEGHCAQPAKAAGDSEPESAIVVFYRNFFKLRKGSSSNGCIVTHYGDLKMEVVDKSGVTSTRWLRNFVPEKCGCRKT